MRIKIGLPERFSFETEIPVLIGHINYGNHLDNALLLTLISEARVRFLQSMGYSELDVAGAGIIVSDAAIQYRSEGFYGDVLKIAMTAQDFSRYGCDFVYQVTEKTAGREIARGKTGIVFFDYEKREKVLVPPEFQKRSAA